MVLAKSHRKVQCLKWSKTTSNCTASWTFLLTFMVNSTNSINNVIHYNYERMEYHVTVFQEHLIIFCVWISYAKIIYIYIYIYQLRFNFAPCVKSISFLIYNNSITNWILIFIIFIYFKTIRQLLQKKMISFFKYKNFITNITE